MLKEVSWDSIPAAPLVHERADPASTLKCGEAHWAKNPGTGNHGRTTEQDAAARGSVASSRQR